MVLGLGAVPGLTTLQDARDALQPLAADLSLTNRPELPERGCRADTGHAAPHAQFPGPLRASADERVFLSLQGRAGPVAAKICKKLCEDAMVGNCTALVAVPGEPQGSCGQALLQKPARKSSSTASRAGQPLSRQVDSRWAGKGSREPPVRVSKTIFHSQQVGRGSRWPKAPWEV